MLWQQCYLLEIAVQVSAILIVAAGKVAISSDFPQGLWFGHTDLQLLESSTDLKRANSAWILSKFYFN